MPKWALGGVCDGWNFFVKETPEPMSEQEQTKQEKTAAPAATASGVTHPLADQYHGYLVEEFKNSLQANQPGVYARWGYTWLHSMSDEEAQAQREAMGFPLADALDHYNHACLLAGREDFAGAAKAFAKAAELKPDLAEAHFNRALALELAGKCGDAREAWMAYLERFGELSEEETRQIKDRLSALADA